MLSSFILFVSVFMVSVAEERGGDGEMSYYDVTEAESKWMQVTNSP